MNAPHPDHSPCARRRGTAAFTLTEAMVSLSIGAIILGGVLTTYIMSVKAFQALANYWEIHADGRYAVDRFAADMRGVSAINSFTSTDITCVIPTAFSTAGIPTTTKIVRYYLNGSSLYRIDSTTGTKKLASNIYQLSFQLFDRLGTPTSSISVAKAIQVDIKLRKFTVSQVQTEDYLSARLDMRNKP